MFTVCLLSAHPWQEVGGSAAPWSGIPACSRCPAHSRASASLLVNDSLLHGFSHGPLLSSLPSDPRLKPPLGPKHPTHVLPRTHFFIRYGTSQAPAKGQEREPWASGGITIYHAPTTCQILGLEALIRGPPDPGYYQVLPPLLLDGAGDILAQGHAQSQGGSQDLTPGQCDSTGCPPQHWASLLPWASPARSTERLRFKVIGYIAIEN